MDTLPPSPISQMRKPRLRTCKLLVEGCRQDGKARIHTQALRPMLWSAGPSWAPQGWLVTEMALEAPRGVLALTSPVVTRAALRHGFSVQDGEPWGGGMGNWGSCWGRQQASWGCGLAYGQGQPGRLGHGAQAQGCSQGRLQSSPVQSWMGFQARQQVICCLLYLTRNLCLEHPLCASLGPGPGDPVSNALLLPSWCLYFSGQG